jgi:hypothetical protein
MSWRDLARRLATDPINPINPETIADISNFQDIQDIQDGNQTLSIKLSGITLADLKRLAGDEWGEIKDSPEELRAFAHLVAARRMRERGEVPKDYTAKTECPHCGVVPIWEGAPDKVLSCVWCFNRVDGKPMPTTR